MMALRPRSRAEAAYSNNRSGVRCAEMTRTSCAIDRDSRVSAAACIVSQSDEDPMMMPTRAFMALSLAKPIRATAGETQKAPGPRPEAVVPAAPAPLFPGFGRAPHDPPADIP